MSELKFPNGFLWGTATASHQIEGNNTNNQWWEWEQNKDYSTGMDKVTGKKRKWPLEPSGIACDSYNRYEEDFDLCVDMNNNAVRFSVEWSRLEPTEGVFNQDEFDHYKKVIEAAKSRGLEVYLTFHILKNLFCFVMGGFFPNQNAHYYFSRFAKKCAEQFGDSVDSYLTINEPQVYTMQSYLTGEWPPQKNNPFYALFVQFNLLYCHSKAFDAIKSVNKNLKVGLVKHIVWYESFSPWYKIWDHIVVKGLYWLNCDMYLWPIKNKLDLIGLNHYFTSRIKDLKSDNANDLVSDLGWWLYAPGLENILLRLRKYKLPIYVTENGLADKADINRKWFLKEMLTACHNAISKGTDLKGYFYWSLLDNYEWHQGYWPRFGIINIDRENGLKRIPQASAKYYAEIAKNNRIV